MLTGHRLAYIAFGLALGAVLLWAVYYVGFELGQQRGQADQYANGYAANAKQQIANTCNRLTGSALTECMAEIVDATREHQRGEYDLNAQREMAEWAKYMLVATAIMAIITGLGVYFVWKTLLATQGMAADTRKIGEAQARGYLGFIPKNISVVFLGDPDQTATVDIHGVIENSGQSPAYDVSISFGIEVVPKDDEPRLHANLTLSSSRRTSNQILPKGSVQQTLSRKFRVSRTDLEAETAFLWILFCIKYVDVFDRDIETPIGAGYVYGVGSKDGLKIVWAEIDDAEES